MESNLDFGPKLSPELAEEFEGWEQYGYDEANFLRWRRMEALPEDASPRIRLAVGQGVYGSNESYVMDVAERRWQETHDGNPPVTLLFVTAEQAEEWWDFSTSDSKADPHVAFEWLRWDFDVKTAIAYWNVGVKEGAAAYAMYSYGMTPRKVKKIRESLFFDADMETLVRYANGDDE